MPYVEQADFCNNGVSPRGAITLFPSFHRNLRVLDFSMNKQGSKGTQILTEAFLENKNRYKIIFLN